MRRWGNLSIVAGLLVVFAIVAIVVSDPMPPPREPYARRVEHVPAPRDVDVDEDVDEPVDEHEPVASKGDIAPADMATKLARARARYRRLTQKNAPDVLEVLVLQDGKGLPDLRVRLRAAAHGEMFEGLEPGEDDRIAFTDGAGRASFDKIVPAHYMIGVETRDNALLTTYQLVRAGKETTRQIIAVGGGGIAGRIFDREGRPVPDSRVMVTLWDAPSGATRLFAMARTNASGSYVVSNLPRGQGRVYCQLERSIDFTLTDGEIARADFGSSEAPVAWTGGLRTRSGASFGGLESVVASDMIDGEGYAIALDEAGRFAARVPPGEYRVWSPCDPPLELGQVALRGKTLALDLVVPGVSVSGVMKYVGAQGSGASEERVIELSVQHVGDEASLRTCSVAVGQRYLFAGLDAGKWLITTRPLPLLGAQAKGLEITLDGARDRVALDVLVTDP